MTKPSKLLLLLVMGFTTTAFASTPAAHSDWTETSMTKVERATQLQQKAIRLSANGDIKGALKQYETLQLLIHQTEGVNSLKQAPILAAMVNLYIKLGDRHSAYARERMHLTLHERAFGKNSLEMLPALKQRARWESATGRWADAMFTFEDAIKIVKKNGRKHGFTQTSKQELLALNRAADRAAARMYAQDALMAQQR